VRLDISFYARKCSRVMSAPKAEPVLKVLRAITLALLKKPHMGKTFSQSPGVTDRHLVLGHVALALARVSRLKLKRFPLRQALSNMRGPSRVQPDSLYTRRMGTSFKVCVRELYFSRQLT